MTLQRITRNRRLTQNARQHSLRGTEGQVMGINLKNDRAEQLARQVAVETGESLTDAIVHALEERLERLEGRQSVPDLTEALMTISRRCRSLPDLDDRSADEILGYDETPPANEGLVDWLLACPEKGFSNPIESESTDTTSGYASEEDPGPA
jgi:antitoxin VapB